MWLGIAGMRPYTDQYAPFNWRGLFDFGCGSLGDMACHILGAANVALKLGSPASVECVMQEGRSKYYYPSKSVIRYDFPARGPMPPVRIFWSDAMQAQPDIRGIPAREFLGDMRRWRVPGGAQPEGGLPFIQGQIFTDAYLEPGAGPEAPKEPPPADPNDANARLDAQVSRLTARGSNGSLFVGDKGMITTGTYGECTRLVPMERMKGYKWPAQFLTRSPGHYRDWIRASKGGDPACSNFDVAAPFTEWLLLGVLALHFEGKLEWDAEKMRVTNNADANRMLRPAVRKGWRPIG